ncbi:MAG: TlyA family RNA methyltransferase [Chloroflexi bacterium]|nr:TlyA family RNA methyltransferase [Chloroflexota bacterium]
MISSLFDFSERRDYLVGVAKKRLDVLLLERQLVESLRRGQALIMAGRVSVNDQKVEKAGTLVPEDAAIVVKQPIKYVGRGGLKLEGALAHFKVNPTGVVCADVGAAIGGFTDCLLQHGASRVIAIDVGYGQLAWKLHTDARVIVLDRVNIRQLESLEELVDLATIDVSFISLTMVLPIVRKMLQPWGQVIALIKPQFEAAREQVGKGGIIRDSAVHRQVIAKIAEFAERQNWRVLGLAQSRVPGADGNLEFFIHLTVDEMLSPINWQTELDSLFSK